MWKSNGYREVAPLLRKGSKPFFARRHPREFLRAAGFGLRSPSFLRETGWDCVWLGAALVLGLGLRLHALGAESATGDEIFILKLLGAKNVPAFLSQSFSLDPTARLAPLFGLLAYGWAALFGPGLFTARLLPVMLGLACIPLSYWLGWVWSGRFAARTAAFLTAAALPQIFFSQDVRFYALFNLLSLLSIGSLAQWLRTNQDKWGWAHGMLNAALLWTHAFVPVLWCAEALWLAWLDRRKLGPWLAGHFFLLGLFAVWLGALDYSPSVESSAYHDRPASWREAGAALLMFAGGRFSEENPARYMPGGVSLDEPLGAALLALAAIAGLQAWRARDAKPGQFRGVALLVLWLHMPPLLLWMVSETWRMVFYTRYMLHAGFAALLLMSIGLASIPQAWLRRGLCLLVLGMLAWQALAIPRPFRADYQSAARDIRQDKNPSVHALKPFNARAAAHALDLPDYRAIENWGLPELCQETMDDAREGRPVWVLFHRWDRTGDFEQAMRNAGFRCERREWPGMPPLIGYRVSLAAENR